MGFCLQTPMICTIGLDWSGCKLSAASDQGMFGSALMSSRSG